MALTPDEKAGMKVEQGDASSDSCVTADVEGNEVQHHKLVRQLKNRHISMIRSVGSVSLIRTVC